MGLRVLLIDDSAMMRKMVSRALRQADLEVDATLEAENGQEGLEVLRADAPDVALCDWNMPVMDGLTFVAESRKFSSVPVVMITTEGGVEKVSAALDAGASGYITKPFTPDDLAAKISDAIDEARRRAQ